ncbi:MAG: amidohydrolase [Candidatus Thorarchaeota archaeon]|nr:MAG: amidohydrolase [Candidatus Thorarchaeota archaeon]RLI59079.1 MAG: amidohydrolase [Candidatus Thorarchaeota archaeon]
MSEGLLIENGLIVTCNEKGSIIESGFVRVKNDHIVEVAAGAPEHQGEERVDARGCVVIPGLISAHTHLYGILLRGAQLNIEPPTDFAQVLQRVWWPVDEALTVEDAYSSALSASAEMLRSGSTFFADTYSGPNSISGSLEAIARGVREVGIKGMLAFELTERHNHKEAEQGLKEGISFIKSIKKDPLLSGMVSVHASFTVGDDIVVESVKTARELEVPITIHTSEGLVDLYHNLETSGERTVERLQRLGLLGPKTVLAHCVHVDDNEIRLIAESGSSVAHNPMSNMLNAVGVAPVPKMLQEGITVGLGNDGWIFDPFENMRCALTVHRLASGNPSAIGPNEILQMATLEGAKCYGLQDQIGSIEMGKKADLVILDGSHIATPLTAESVVGHLINSFSGRDVRDVYVNGEKVVESGSLTRVTQSHVTETSRASAARLWDDLKQR